MTTADAVVVGGGISGLTAAHELVGAGLDVVLVEASPRVGGALATERADGWVVETGANTVVDRRPLADLATEIGLEPKRADAAAAARFVWHEGALHRVPTGPLSLLRSSLLPLGAKLRLLAEPWSEPAPEDEESVAELVRRRLGAAVLERLVAPFVAGVHAGDPERLSARHALPRLTRLEGRYGSLLLGALRAPKRDRPRPVSFDHGLVTLPLALASEIQELQLGTSVDGVERRGERLVVTTAEGAIDTSRVVLATPVRDAASILSAVSGGASDALAEMPHSPVAVVALGFRRDDVATALDGFGFLSADSDVPLLGCLYSSTLFPDSAPPDHVLLTAFLGGYRRPEAVDLERSELVESTTEALDHAVGLRSGPVFASVTRWRPGIPQYEVGHQRILALVAEIESRLPGLVIVGNYLEGVAIPDCIAIARRKSRRLLADRD